MQSSSIECIVNVGSDALCRSMLFLLLSKVQERRECSVPTKEKQRMRGMPRWKDDSSFSQKYRSVADGTGGILRLEETAPSGAIRYQFARITLGSLQAFSRIRRMRQTRAWQPPKEG